MKTTMEMAEVWGVNVRTVQKWAKEGKLEGAQKASRDWLIPDAVKCPLTEKSANQKPPEEETLAMPFMNGIFMPGEGLAYIETLENPESRALAMAEYHYFCGNSEKSRLAAEKLIQSEDRHICISAFLVHLFSCIGQGRIEEARQNIGIIQGKFQGIKTQQGEASGLLVRCLTAVLLHNTKEIPVPMEQFAKFLPGGTKLFACYALAHLWYLKGDYSRSLGTAETGLSMASVSYPISLIYLNLIAAVDCMNLRDTEKAKAYVELAWDLVKKDGFYQPFGEHHGLLQGLVEVCLKKEDPVAYGRIVEITYDFGSGWRKIHNSDTNESVTDQLTTTEFSIAMLASKKWSNRQIAQFMDVSLGTVKNRISDIYEKLNITNRKDLKKFLLK